MKKNIEKNIRYKAIFLYASALISVLVMIFYINDLRREMVEHKQNINSQNDLLFMTNELVFSVSEAQSQSGGYLLNKKKLYLDNYKESLEKIGELIDTIVVLIPQEEGNLRKIDTLLRRQSQNIIDLTSLLRVKNPVKDVSVKIKSYEQPLKNDTVIVAVQNDTLLQEVPKKNFIKRLGEVFKPSKDSVQLLITQRIDTVRDMQLKDSLEVIYDVVESAAENAELEYEKNIYKIESKVNNLVSSDKAISAEITSLLLQFHKHTIDAANDVIDRSELILNKNYKYLTRGGILVLILILIFILLIITDVNRGLKARKELESANDIIKKTMDSRHKLLLSVSHDIKTPLNSITGYLELMNEDESIKSMKNSSSHILSLLTNLLDFSSLEQGKLLLNNTEFGVKELCREVYEMFLPLAKNKHLNLDFECTDIMISSDKIKIKQLLINLVSNAIKYSSEGDVFFEVIFKDNNLSIIVEDTGIGIPQEKMDKLFKPFSRVEENNKMAEGTGLGLFVVKGITDLMKGEIKYNSQAGLGTKVEVILPVNAVSIKKEKRSLRISVFDDEPVMITVVTGMLMRLGHIIVDADPDLVITDMEMGDISGYDILKRYNDLPVIVMTGKSDYNNEKAKSDGFSDYLAKPVSIESIKSIIGEGESFEDSFGEDFNEIVSLFKTSAIKDMEKLRLALDNDNFDTAVSICHKMRPMFLQLGYPVEELTKMDLNKNSIYDNWKDDVTKILLINID